MTTVNIFYGSVYGGAERLADTICDHIEKAGLGARIIDNPQVEDLQNSDVVLVITSTTGQGDIPDNLSPLFMQLQHQFPMLTDIPFGVIAMGDSSYGDTFCGAGKQFDAFLAELQATRVCDRLDVDALEDFDPEPVALPWVNDFLKQL